MEPLQITIAGFLITFAVALWGLFRFVSTSVDTVRKDLQTELKDAIKDMETRRNEMRTEIIQAIKETESRFSNQIGRSEGKLDQVLERIALLPSYENRLAMVEGRRVRGSRDDA